MWVEVACCEGIGFDWAVEQGFEGLQLVVDGWGVAE